MLSFMDIGFSIRSHWLAGELAKAAGVSTDTLRHYERKGVLNRPRRASNGYRLYPENALSRVLLVRRALSVGFTLDELARILGERDKGGTPCREARHLVAEKLQSVEELLIALAALRDELRLTLDDWDKRLSVSGSDAKAHLLETLVSDSTGKNQTNGTTALKTEKKKNPFPKSK
jgi:DNA-binding transcriptional MerR regulator